jgi:hypothetical protein
MVASLLLGYDMVYWGADGEKQDITKNIRRFPNPHNKTRS